MPKYDGSETKSHRDNNETLERDPLLYHQFFFFFVQTRGESRLNRGDWNSKEPKRSERGSRKWGDELLFLSKGDRTGERQDIVADVFHCHALMWALKRGIRAKGGDWGLLGYGCRKIEGETGDGQDGSWRWWRAPRVSWKGERRRERKVIRES